MPNYKKMYYMLFNKITAVIEELQQIQQHSEEMYIQSESTEIVAIKPNSEVQPNEKERQKITLRTTSET